MATRVCHFSGSPFRALSLLLLLSCAAAAMGAGTTVLPQPPLPSPLLAAAAVQPASPFTIIGFLQKATLDTAADPLSGGTIVVNDHTIRVGANTVVNMPGTFLKWSELFSLAPAPWGPAQTGLALADVPKPLTTYEVMVQGNRIIAAGNDQYIAGLIFISQESLNFGQGFINFIDYATEEMRVGGVLNDRTTGARLRLNDPAGRFGRPMSPDARFAIDENNPTVRTATGYPMCIPRVNLAAATPANPVADDPLCPQTNRPKDPNGGFLRLFTLPPPACSFFDPLPTGAPSVVPPNCTLNPPPGTPDATQQMPFEVGDYVTFQGTLVAETTTPACVPRPGAPLPPPGPACQYISAWSVIASIGAFTSPGTMPAYVAVDVTLMGTGGILNRGLPQEATSIARVEGFTTDPTEPVDIYGVDIDPCTGETSDRYWGTQPVQALEPMGRFRFLPLGGTFTPPVREIRAVSQTLSQGAIPATIVASNTFANGLVAGQYDAPMSKFIFPESAEVGLTRIPFNFQDFPYLMQNPAPAGTARGCTAAVSPTTLSFSDQPLGKASAPQMVTLNNTGAGGLNISSVFISPGYSQTNDCGTHLPVGGSCTFSVSFLPKSAEPQTGVLQISDTATGGPQTVSLLGTVALPAPSASWSSAALTFSDQAPLSASAPQTLTLTNTGTAALKISGVYQSLGYWQSNNCGSELPAGESCTFTVRFMPKMPGAYSGNLHIADNAAGSPHIVSLSGSASDFDIGPEADSPMSAAVFAGQAADYKLSVWGTPLAAGTVSLSCSGLPAGATCAFSPAAVTLHGAQSQSLTVSIATLGPRALGSGTAASRAPAGFSLTLTLFGGVIAAVFTRRHPRKFLLVFLAACALTLSGCGGGFGEAGSSASGAQITVTATSSNGAVHSVHLRLTIKNRPTSKPRTHPIQQL